MCQFLIFHLIKILSSLNPTNPNSDSCAAYASSLFTSCLLIVVTGLTEDEKNRIHSVSDFKKLDAALDAIVLSDNRQGVLKLLT